MRKSYTYPAIFEYAPDGINISFPDLPGCLSCAENNSEAIYMAEDALELRLKSDLKSGALISEPTDILELQNSLHDNQVVTLIRVDLQLQDERDTKAINKMVTLPQWLITAGKEADINFSHLLQDALIERLGIKREIKRRKLAQPR